MKNLALLTGFQYYLMINAKKTKTVCNSDTAYITQLKSKKKGSISALEALRDALYKSTSTAVTTVTFAALP